MAVGTTSTEPGKDIEMNRISPKAAGAIGIAPEGSGGTAVSGDAPRKPKKAGSEDCGMSSGEWQRQWLSGNVNR